MSVGLPDTIRYETHGRVAVVTFNRPEARNAWTEEMIEGFEAVMASFAEDDDLWVAIVTGVGEQSFCAGADLGEVIPKAVDDGIQTVISDPSKRFLSEISKPIIAAVNGHCVAGGLELMLGTDLRLAVPHAQFGLGEVRWGVVPAGGSHIRLPRQIPWAVAMEILLTGRPITAERAHAVGLINHVVPAGELMPRAMDLAELLCTNGPIAVRSAKEIAVRSLELEPKFRLELDLAKRVLETEDAKEGPRAFMEKRRPRYEGR